jgi:glutathione S-transferase
MFTLYDQSTSGNAYKIRLLLHQLGHDFRTVEINTFDGSTRTPEFLARNPVGKVPVLELPSDQSGGGHLAESNAILCYLADGTPFWPGDALARAQVLSWLFFEQYSHEPYIAVLRSWSKYLDMTPEMTAREPDLRARGYAALDVMEKQLQSTDWLVGDSYTIADICLYAYTHVADEGAYDISQYSWILSWFERVRTQQGYVPITWQPAQT